MWNPFKSKEEPVKIEPNRESVLYILYYSGGEDSFRTDISGEQSLILPYKHIYKWFFSREQSKYFTFVYDIGSLTICRKDIKRLRITEEFRR